MKQSGRPPAFQFYAKDWISSKTVRMLNPTQRGYYIQLLAEAWDSTPIGTLPNDPAMLRILAAEPDQAEWDKHSPAVIAIFKKLRGNMLASERLVKERDKQIERKSKCKMAGHISASSRKEKRLATNKRSTDVGTNGQQKTNSSSSSSISSSTANTKTKTIPAEPGVFQIETVEQFEARQEKPQIVTANTRHIRIQAMLMAAYSAENGGTQCPWDGGEGKQLQAFLRATPGWHDSQISQCLANMYASTGFPKGTRPREFLPRLPKYLNGPLNEFNREQTHERVNTAQARSQRIRERTHRVIESISGGSARALQDGNGRCGIPGLAANSPQLQAGGSDRRGERIDAESAGGLDGTAKAAGCAAGDPSGA